MSAQGPGHAGNGQPPSPPDDPLEPLIRAMEAAYPFPTYYPVVIIAVHGEDFRGLLMATLAALQGEDPFRVSERASRKGTYISYRIEVFVASARTALERKTSLGQIEGVLVLL